MPLNNLSRDWARFIKARRLPSISFQPASTQSRFDLLISSKLDPVIVARRVGHASSTTTMRTYAHMWRQTDHVAADAAEAALETALTCRRDHRRVMETTPAAFSERLGPEWDQNWRRRGLSDR